MLAVSHPEVLAELADERGRKPLPPERDRTGPSHDSASFTPPVFGFRRQLAAFLLHGTALSDTRSARELDHCLLRALERLHRTDPKLARVFDLYFFAGAAHPAIASALEITAEESEIRLRAARERIAQDLEATPQS